MDKITNPKAFAVVNAVADAITATLRKYAEHEITSEQAKELFADEMTEMFEGVLTQLHAIEILECVEWKDDTPHDTTYIVQFHDLIECQYGFDMLKMENVSKTTCFHFANASEAFQMLRDFLTI